MKGMLDSLANAELCTQCGYCLPVCPTYRAENSELHSPRGRVSVVLALQAGTLTPAEAAGVLEHCLVCRACHAACPAGVRPAKLAMVVRAEMPIQPTWLSRMLHHVTNSHPLTARCSALLSVYQRSGLQRVMRRLGLLRLLPPLERVEALLPAHRPAESVPPFPARPEQPGRPRIALLSGCMGRLFYPAVAPSAAQLLAQWGGEVLPLTGFGCCGAPFRESGDRPTLVRQARRTLDAFLAVAPVQAVVCDSSVCAVTIRSYARLLADDKNYAAAAKLLAARVYTLSQFLADKPGELSVSPRDPGFGSVAYHNHCQARYGLGIMREAGLLLSALPIVYRDLWQEDAPSEGCCGAGGAYQLHHPQRSQKIRAAKLAAIEACGAETVVGENPGCLMHIAAGLEQAGSTVRVRHLAELLWAAHSS
ncbi:MAG: (Fe-S)-binding protein [Magnetococcales bacterium]|nr:(Fe-S)-binding protein [Magnetococcales bacterium]